MIDELFDLSRSFVENYHRDYRRYFLRKFTLENRFSIITGPRGVGKTTAIIQYLRQFTGGDIHSREAIYIQADHFLVGAHSIYEITEQLVKEGGKLICLDEIHKYSGWSRELKSINDTFPQLKILASGSSAMEIHKGSHDLSRRAIVYPMHVMSFREFIELNLNIAIPAFTLQDLMANHPGIASSVIRQIEAAGNKILPLFHRYIDHGCYPYFLEYPNKELFHITLEQNVRTTIESDLPAVVPGLSGAGVKKIKKLIAYIAESVPFSPDLKKIKRILDIGDERTLKNYLKYLEDAGIIQGICKKGRSLRVLEKPEKIFLNNTNLMHAIGSRDNLQKGNLRETFFAITLGAFHTVNAADKGDFIIDEKYVFEVGGKGKNFEQIKDLENSYLALDDIETGGGNKIPLWLFGFLY